MYVLEPNLQFFSDGTVISIEEQTHVWVPRIIKKLKISNLLQPITQLPSVQQPLHKLNEQSFTGENWKQFISLVC